MLSLAVLGGASLTANAYRIVGFGFRALSRPVHPPMVEMAGVEPASNTLSLQRLAGFRLPTIMVTAGRRKPLVVGCRAWTLGLWPFGWCPRLRNDGPAILSRALSGPGQPLAECRALVVGSGLMRV